MCSRFFIVFVCADANMHMCVHVRTHMYTVHLCACQRCISTPKNVKASCLCPVFLNTCTYMYLHTLIWQGRCSKGKNFAGQETTCLILLHLSPWDSCSSWVQACMRVSLLAAFLAPPLVLKITLIGLHVQGKHAVDVHTCMVSTCMHVCQPLHAYFHYKQNGTCAISTRKHGYQRKLSGYSDVLAR